jgi:hypothetical protein
MQGVFEERGDRALEMPDDLELFEELEEQYLEALARKREYRST